MLPEMYSRKLRELLSGIFDRDEVEEIVADIAEKYDEQNLFAFYPAVTELVFR